MKCVILAAGEGKRMRPLISVIVILQLLAYHTARELECEIDKPRNWPRA
jgi:glucosamine 6-phosphate synthetase-like amidotransferase/phosphosugar isomerase protein